MSGILLAGLVDKEAAAIEIMIGMYWPDRSCVTLARSPGLKVPQRVDLACAACDLCIVDLFGLGMRRHSEAHEQRLLEFLDGRLAVLLLRGLENGWMERVLPLAPGQKVRTLMTPYKAQALRECISKVLQAQGPLINAQRPVSTRAPSGSKNSLTLDLLEPGSRSAAEEWLPAWRRAGELAKRLQSAGNHTAASKSRPEPQPLPVVDSTTKHTPWMAPTTAAVPFDPQPKSVQKRAQPMLRQQAGAVGLGRGAMDALLTLFPLLRNLPIVALGTKIVNSKGAQLINLQPDTEIVLNFREGWLVCNLADQDLRKLALTPHLASTLQIVNLPEPYVENLMRQRQNGSPRRAQMALDEVTWHLFADALRDQVLVPEGDMRIQLRRFPNITALNNTSSLDIQLATVCAFAPHYVSDLLRAFPRHEQAVLRFVVLATVSGLMSVLADDAPALQAEEVSVDTTASENRTMFSPQVRAQRNFFKSLLEKLF